MIHAFFGTLLVMLVVSLIKPKELGAWFAEIRKGYEDKLRELG